MLRPPSFLSKSRPNHTPALFSLSPGNAPCSPVKWLNPSPPHCEVPLSLPAGLSGRWMASLDARLLLAGLVLPTSKLCACPPDLQVLCVATTGSINTLSLCWMLVPWKSPSWTRRAAADSAPDCMQKEEKVRPSDELRERNDRAGPARVSENQIISTLGDPQSKGRVTSRVQVGLRKAPGGSEASI